MCLPKTKQASCLSFLSNSSHSSIKPSILEQIHPRLIMNTKLHYWRLKILLHTSHAKRPPCKLCIEEGPRHQWKRTIQLLVMIIESHDPLHIGSMILPKLVSLETFLSFKNLLGCPETRKRDCSQHTIPPQNSQDSNTFRTIQHRLRLYQPKLALSADPPSASYLILPLK